MGTAWRERRRGREGDQNRGQLELPPAPFVHPSDPPRSRSIALTASRVPTLRRIDGPADEDEEEDERW